MQDAMAHSWHTASHWRENDGRLRAGCLHWLAEGWLPALQCCAVLTAMLCCAGDFAHTCCSASLLCRPR